MGGKALQRSQVPISTSVMGEANVQLCAVRCLDAWNNVYCEFSPNEVLCPMDGRFEVAAFLEIGISISVKQFEKKMA